EAEPRAGPLEPGRGVDHLGRGVQAADLGLRPAPGQLGGELAGATAQVHDQAGVLGPDLGRQLEERTRALVAEAQILTGIPHGDSSSQGTSLDVKISTPCLCARKSRCQEICCSAWRRLTATRSTTWWPSGARSGPTWMCRPWRC